ncbi:hypothetical protein [Synechococcus sp. C9]|uniref:hypothetical protein n=1 Tax=Synechococcus sp. C9 TaxID=102119 RepID=UPI001FF1CC6A|nr:hypothetical protein [Synechococcus sp. C9]
MPQFSSPWWANPPQIQSHLHPSLIHITVPHPQLRYCPIAQLPHPAPQALKNLPPARVELGDFTAAELDH